jgi:hypothetical protein
MPLDFAFFCNAVFALAGIAIISLSSLFCRF